MTYKDKSDFSWNAADLLAKNKLYPSAVNRFYYSFLQLLLHVLCNKCSMTKEEAEKFRKEKEGSHTFAMRIVGYDLAKVSQQEYLFFKQKSLELKQLRTDADYSENTIGPGESADASNLSDLLKRSLRKHFR